MMGLPQPSQTVSGRGASSIFGSLCADCAIAASRENLVNIARFGRLAAQSQNAQKRRAEAQRRHEAEKRKWSPATLPAWLNNETYAQKIQPRLAGLTNGAIASALGVSMPYAADIRVGRRRPHPRHWQELAGLVNINQIY